jgi:hypothetical protein
MRVTSVTVLLLAIAAAIAAAAAAAPDPRQPRQQHTAFDMSRARSIALKASDLGAGWSGAPQETTPCSAEPDESSLVQTGGFDRTFLGPDRSTTVGSRVEIFRSAGQAQRDWRLGTLRQMGDCLLQRTRARFAPRHVGVRLITAMALKPPTRGERSLHYRIVLLLSAGAQSVPLVTDIVGIGIGRISVLLRASTPAAPIPVTALQSLTGVLAQRLVTAAGGI